MSRADRLLRFIQILRRYRQPVSAQSLANELEVSIRSVYRDVQTLRGEGATIEGEPGVGYLLRPRSTQRIQTRPRLVHSTQQVVLPRLRRKRLPSPKRSRRR